MSVKESVRQDGLECHLEGVTEAVKSGRDDLRKRLKAFVFKPELYEGGEEGG